MKLRYYLTFIFPLFVSGIIVYISLDIEKWKVFWTFFNIPLQIPPFSDLDSISRALPTKIDLSTPDTRFENRQTLERASNPNGLS